MLKNNKKNKTKEKSIYFSNQIKTINEFYWYEIYINIQQTVKLSTFFSTNI